MPKCDLQVHSRFSDRPSEWVLRKLGVPESYTDPLEIHRRLGLAGFDFITITDHNRIEGGLELAHLPGTFLSEEVTTYFPGDGCKVHLLVWNITEGQHAEIQQLRPNIFELAAYLRSQDIAHGVAHRCRASTSISPRITSSGSCSFSPVSKRSTATAIH